MRTGEEVQMGEGKEKRRESFRRRVSRTQRKRELRKEREVCVTCEKESGRYHREQKY